MERKIFFSTRRDSVKTLDATSFICIAGDFNCTICPSIDRNGHDPHVASTKMLEDTIKNYRFKDMWRSQHPLLRCDTWCRCNDGIMSMARLDRFYVNKLMLNVVSSTQIVPTGFTDHSLISMSFKLNYPFHPVAVLIGLSILVSYKTRVSMMPFESCGRKFVLLDLILIVSGCGGILQKPK